MVYYWLSWLSVVLVGFFFSKDLNLKRLFLWILILNIIFINSEIQFGDFTFTLPFVYTFVAFLGITILKSMPYFNYYLLFCLIFFYLSLRFILITSPIWLFVNHYLIIGTLILLFVILLIRNHQEQIYLLVLSCLTGEFLYASYAKKLVWEVVIGEPELFLSLYLIIFLLYFFRYLTMLSQSSKF